MFRHTFVSILILLTTLLCSSVVQAHPLELYSFGSRSIAIAGADVASGISYTSGFTNPAAAALASGPIFGIGIQHFVNKLNIDGNDYGADSVSGIELGIIYPIEISPTYDIRFGSGIALYVPQQRVVRIRLLPAYVPRFLQFDNRVHRLSGTFYNSLSWGKLSVGLGINLFAGADGRGALFDMSSAPGKPDYADTDLILSLDTVIYASAGIMWKDENFDIGFFFIDKVQLEVSTATDASLDIDIGYARLTGRAGTSLHTVNYYTPRTYGLGGSVLAAPWARVWLSLLILDWTTYPGAVSEITPDIELNIGESAFPVEVITYKHTKNEMGIQFMPSLGCEFTVDTNQGVNILFRAGYRYANTPLEHNDDAQIVLIDSDRHELSAGVGIDVAPFSVFTGNIEINFSAIFMWLTGGHYDAKPQSPVQPFDFGGFSAGGGIDVQMHF